LTRTPDPARSNDASAFVREGECCGTSDTGECASNQHDGILHERLLELDWLVKLNKLIATAGPIAMS
jgi:hypothetical protein